MTRKQHPFLERYVLNKNHTKYKNNNITYHKIGYSGYKLKCFLACVV